jgi:4-diphosphocytidyl-2-C-methyl-D-erythritol kinase
MTEKTYYTRSYAKINLGLRIVGKRPDGFHNLESVFQEIDIFDEISIRKIDNGVRIISDHSNVPLGVSNICYKAFEKLKTKVNLKMGVEIEIKKRIPIGAGLGGGSSNAASCLKIFNQMFQLHLTPGELLLLAAQIGSDVPFFIMGKSALVKGRGEIVIPISFLDDYLIVLVYPNIVINTSFIYKNFEMNLTAYESNFKFEAVIFETKKIEDLNRYFFNDLENVAFESYPILKNIKKRFKWLNAKYISLSGSGSSVFGLFNKAQELAKIKRELKEFGQVFITRPIS